MLVGLSGILAAFAILCRARWLTAALLAAGLLGAGLCWIVHAPDHDFARTDGDLLVELFRPDGQPGCRSTLPSGSALLGTGNPDPGQYLQNRVSIVDTGRINLCHRSPAPAGCAFNRIALLASCRFGTDKPFAANLLLVGMRTGAQANDHPVAIRHIDNILMGSARCGKRALTKAGVPCGIFRLSGMMLIPFDDPVTGLSAIFLQRDRLVGRGPEDGTPDSAQPAVETGAVGGLWQSVVSEQPD